MWIFTVNGFFTVIQDRKDPNYVWLRSRLREDIERNFPGVEVRSTRVPTTSTGPSCPVSRSPSGCSSWPWRTT
jgi:hypothetical protein